MSHLQKNTNNTVFSVTKQKGNHYAVDLKSVNAQQQAPHIPSTNNPVDDNKSETLAAAFKASAYAKYNVDKAAVSKLILAAKEASVAKDAALKVEQDAYKVMHVAKYAAQKTEHEAIDAKNRALTVADDESGTLFLDAVFASKGALEALRIAEKTCADAVASANVARNVFVVATNAATNFAGQVVSDTYTDMCVAQDNLHKAQMSCKHDDIEVTKAVHDIAKDNYNAACADAIIAKSIANNVFMKNT